MLDNPDTTESLLERTKILLQQRGGLTLREIAAGAGVGYEWLRKLAYNGVDDPGVARVERVHRYLTEYQIARRFQSKDAARVAGQ
jgi:hypothetical protein